MNNTEKAYKEIFKVLNKYKDDVIFDINSLKKSSELHLFGIKLKDEYGLNIDPKYVNRFDWYEVNRYCHICTWGTGHSISWSDDKRQPEIGEVLVVYSFPTGAYIFGSSYENDYPTEFFKSFWDELKSYSPKYCDTVNHSLYFSIETAKDVFNNFNEILKKYHDLNQIEFRQRKIDKMKQEIAKLELV